MPTADGCSRLDLAVLMREGVVVPGRQVTATVSAGGSPGFRVLLDADMRDAAMAGITIRHLDRPELGSYRLRLVSAPQRLGGVRWWFVCRHTGKRARVLLMPNGSSCFASRGAYPSTLSYRCQREVPGDRLCRRARKQRAKLGLRDPNLSAPLPPRPKRMRITTYRRLRDQADAAEEAATMALFAGNTAFGRHILRRVQEAAERDRKAATEAQEPSVGVSGPLRAHARAECPE